MATTTATQETKGFYKLSWVQRIGGAESDLSDYLHVSTFLLH